MNERRTWASQVGKIFDTRPRIRNSKTVWLERKNAYKAFATAIERPGSHVCLDGPTGVGKTSLVHTYIAAEEVPHSSIMITDSMSWKDFCRRLVGPRLSTERSTSGEIEAGIQNGLPTAKFKVSLGGKTKTLDDLALGEQVAAAWTEHDVAKELAERDLILVIDDLERATDELIKRVADVCKLMTQEYTSPNSKVVMIGSGNIFVRLHVANPALDERVSQVSLGAFKNSNDSRLFVMLGLQKIGLRHPWNSVLSTEVDLRDRCREAIWEAANGLPKSLNHIGYEIAMRGRDRKAISANDIFECSQKMIEEHWIQYSEEFPEVLDLLERDAVAAEIVKCMYEAGITRIHSVNRVLVTASSPDPSRPAYPLIAVEKSLGMLVGTGFVIRTGKSGELLFVKHPAAAHTLGVIMRDPNKVKHLPVPRRPKGMPSQLKFAFPQPDGGNPLDNEVPSDDA